MVLFGTSMLVDFDELVAIIVKQKVVDSKEVNYVKVVESMSVKVIKKVDVLTLEVEDLLGVVVNSEEMNLKVIKKVENFEIVNRYY